MGALDAGELANLLERHLPVLRYDSAPAIELARDGSELAIGSGLKPPRSLRWR